MIIVWLSLALVVLAIIWLIVRVIQEAKKIKDTVVHVSKAAEKLREGGEDVVKKQESLQEAAKAIQKDIDGKSEALRYTVDQGQALIGTLRETKDQLITAYRARSSERHRI
ncbi:hypothetical protein ACFO4N_12910 [Camelliibacillus cellulosilyticus]|uniref:DUF948 domain-containing protein n=1 Tax=Camelliibacillus cellulosilyticus TaxID=2174486 RepID=A0ABV9GSC8_9BACL